MLPDCWWSAVSSGTDSSPTSTTLPPPIHRSLTNITNPTSPFVGVAPGVIPVSTDASYGLAAAALKPPPHRHLTVIPPQPALHPASAPRSGTLSAAIPASPNLHTSPKSPQLGLISSSPHRPPHAPKTLNPTGSGTNWEPADRIFPARPSFGPCDLPPPFIDR